jgi:hypothetical protein
MPLSARLLRLRAPHLAASVVLLWAPAALADGPTPAPSKQACIGWNTEAQSLRTAGKFAAGRALLLQCQNPACPGAVRDDCTERLDELERQQPKIAFAAKVGGEDRSAVTVAIDGTVVATRVDGRPLLVDAGEHRFTFTTEGVAPITKQFVLREGDRSRSEQIVFEAPAAVVAVTPPTTPTPPEKPVENTPPPFPAPRTEGGSVVPAIAVGATGVVAIGVASVFGLIASSRWKDAQDLCPNAGACKTESALSQKQSAERWATASTVGFVAGGALLAGGAVLFFLRSPAPVTSGRLQIAPTVGPQAAAITISGAF